MYVKKELEKEKQEKEKVIHDIKKEFNIYKGN